MPAAGLGPIEQEVALPGFPTFLNPADGGLPLPRVTGMTVASMERGD